MDELYRSDRTDSLPAVTEKDYALMIRDTSKFVAAKTADTLSSAALGAQESNALTSNVEFWKWIERNYPTYVKNGIFESASNYNAYNAASKAVNGREMAVRKVIQGKGYEWDWMQSQRNNFSNLFKQYDAGDVANRAASDVTESDLITGTSRELQMKAYTSKTNPNLSNTPKNMTVVTNSEKAGIVRQNGYEHVESFQNNEAIIKNTDTRMEQIKSGSVQATYTLKNVSGVMMKAGVTAAVIGMGIETVVSYKAWKKGQLTDEEYLKEIVMAGGDAGLTAAGTSGIMIPITAALTTAGCSTIIGIPIAVVISAGLNKIVAPCFGRGEYREILNDAKYYQNMEFAYKDLISAMEYSSQQYYAFVKAMESQYRTFQRLNEKSQVLDKELDKENKNLERILGEI